MDAGRCFAADWRSPSARSFNVSAPWARAAPRSCPSAGDPRRSAPVLGFDGSSRERRSRSGTRWRRSRARGGDRRKWQRPRLPLGPAAGCPWLPAAELSTCRRIRERRARPPAPKSRRSTGARPSRAARQGSTPVRANADTTLSSFPSGASSMDANRNRSYSGPSGGATGARVMARSFPSKRMRQGRSSTQAHLDVVIAPVV